MPHGRLPPWDVRDLPAPPAFTTRNALRTVGPGVIGLGIAIGSGEWLIGPAVVLRNCGDLGTRSVNAYGIHKCLDETTQYGGAR